MPLISAQIFFLETGLLETAFLETRFFETRCSSSMPTHTMPCEANVPYPLTRFLSIFNFAPGSLLRWLARFNFPNIYAGCLLSHINLGNGLQRFQINHFYGSRFRANAFYRDKGVAVIRSNYNSM